jgi:hypothetical protein
LASPKYPDQLLGLKQLAFKRYRGLFSMESCHVKILTIQIHLSVEVKTLCLYISPLIYAFMAPCFASHSDQKQFYPHSMPCTKILCNDRSLLYRIKKIQGNGTKYKFTSI